MLIYYNIKKIIFLFVLFFFLFGIQVLLVVFSLFRRRVYYIEFIVIYEFIIIFPMWLFGFSGSNIFFLFQFLLRRHPIENFSDLIQ